MLHLLKEKDTLRFFLLQRDSESGKQIPGNLKKLPEESEVVSPSSLSLFTSNHILHDRVRQTQPNSRCEVL